MGTGGAIFVRAGTLEVTNSTFSGNGAIGGDAMTLDNDPGGGGGGLAGWGGPGSCNFGLGEEGNSSGVEDREASEAAAASAMAAEPFSAL